MANPQICIGDFILEEGVHREVIDITESGNGVRYHLDSGSIIGDEDFEDYDFWLGGESW